MRARVADHYLATPFHTASEEKFCELRLYTIGPDQDTNEARRLMEKFSEVRIVPVLRAQIAHLS